MVTSRYVHEIDTTNNGQGLAKSPLTGALDKSCVSEWNEATCTAAAELQDTNYTFIHLMGQAGYDLELFARFDTGAGILQDFPKHDPTGDGFHGGPNLGILARGANIPGYTKSEPFNDTSESVTDPYAEDLAQAQKVLTFLQGHDPNSPNPLFLWFGVLAPHPPYHTNSTYIKHVNASAVDAPFVVPRLDMHPYDVDMSILKNCWADYTSEQLKEMRTAYWGAAAEAMTIFDSILSTAESTGHLNNTVIIFTSDRECKGWRPSPPPLDFVLMPSCPHAHAHAPSPHPPQTEKCPWSIEWIIRIPCMSPRREFLSSLHPSMSPP